MNYYKATQRERDKRWDYTCENGGIIWPVGYCREYINPALSKSAILWPQWEIDKVNANKDKYHVNGHATEDEAYACYKLYELDFRLRLDGKDDGSQRKCEICGNWTQNLAMIGGTRMWHLCDEHLNRETVEKLYSVGECWSSY